MQRQGETATALPPDFDRFIGRDKQLAELSSLFARGARLVSIIGRPGIGKTRLARRFAGTMAGLEVVDALVPDDARLPQLLDALATRPELRVLVTTRAPLGVPGEARLVLGPLEVAAPLQDLGASEASELLLERAREVAAPEIEAWSAATLARALGGVPLALEHAARRLVVLPPDAVIAEAWRGFDVLDRPLALALAALPEAPRHALAQLAVFEGAFDLAAATAILGDDVDAVTILAELHGRGLVA